MAQNQNASSGNPRVRAAKACKRCNQRKVKCDAMKNGLPCSRCRMDNHDDCALVLSRRGNYDRKMSSRQVRLRRNSPPSARGSHPVPLNSEFYENDEGVDEQNSTNTPISCQGINSPFSPASPLQVFPNAPAEHLEPASNAGSASPKNQSLVTQFEGFLNKRTGSSCRQYGLIFLGEVSPLTFALEELPQTSSPQLYDASEHIRDSSNLEVIQQGIHPPHLDGADIAFLKAKGCFELPSEPTLNDLVEAYLTRFHPHYSIMNKREVESCQRERKLPWILIHAICFIGATFCDPPVIHQSKYASRVEARQEFYDKAILLFKIGYHHDKIILLQTAVILSFWGPHMHSYWNPCSWVGFGVTFAISLGIHRSAASSNAPRGDKGLLRRLWWTLVVRDTYCSVLLGRPFRINLRQSDTEMLTPDDFTHEAPEDGFYQTQSASLSIILRDIIHYRLGPGGQDVTWEGVHGRLEKWCSDLKLAPKPCTRTSSASLTCSTTLELLYHYYILLLYIDNPSMNQQEMSPPPPLSPGSAQQDIVQSSAIFIASKAITLVTKTKVCNLPHELFPAFFVAGIILYRCMQQKNRLVAQMAQASLDNCRIVLNEAQESWDPGHWAMQIFDFLCANLNGSATQKKTNMDGSSLPKDMPYPENDRNNMGSLTDGRERNMSSMPETQNTDNISNHTDPCDGVMQFGSNWESLMREDFTGTMGNYLFMPNIFPPDLDGWSFFQSNTY